jgi:amidase
MTKSANIPVPSAAETARRVRSGEQSAVEVIDNAIARIEDRNPSLNSFVHVDFERARARAKEIDAEVVAGRDPGPLAGVPTAVKDLGGMVEGWPSTMGGIRALKERRARVTSNYPRKVESAGAVVLGLTNSPIFGFRAVTDNPLFGATSNPFDTSRSPGGSSGGSAAAVADGLLPVAHADDGGGSIRIPSAWSGVFGFQPSAGRVPMPIRPNAFDTVAPFIYEGVVARTVDDAALVMQAIAGYESSDPWSVPGKVDWMGAPGASIKGKRVGYSPTLASTPVDRRIRTVIEQALEAFSLAGAEIVPIEVDFRRTSKELSEIWLRLVGSRIVDLLNAFKAEGFDVLHNHPEDLPNPIIPWLEEGRRLSLADIHDHQLARTQIFDGFEHAFASVDLIVTPTAGALPSLLTPGRSDGPTEVDGVRIDPLIGWPLTFYTNMTGHPACSLPAGLADGLPVGLQIIGPRYGDADILTAARAFEAHRPWLHLYQRCEERSLAIPAFRLKEK